MTTPVIEFVLSSTASGLFLCERCGLIAGTSSGWPSGWVRTGRSRRRALLHSPEPWVSACWCPQCKVFATLDSNPTEAEVLELIIPRLQSWPDVKRTMQTLARLRAIQCGDWKALTS